MQAKNNSIEKMTFDKLVQKRMFLLIIMLLMITIYFGGIQTGYNRTLGWAFDFSYWILIVKPFLWLAFLIGYGILALLRYWTNKKLSIFHLILIGLTFIAEDILDSDSRLTLTLMLISTIVFIINFVWAIRNRKIKLTKKAST
ncbi:hypothetical protein [Mariniflexile gromovii]|uniref:DUF2127 domain-containing protein n=2 Tax=Mariniflexile gromovii TaxID=362523 RepID=A0ABS4BZ39_9FLAO|nr:hypothetical protein [Mariniflexile gromovii]MBP0905850.1 hypothetical protein [Mariniflexile gromovii]